MVQQIRPMNAKQGVGFFSMSPIEGMEGYRYEQTDRYHNYFFTATNNQWPEKGPHQPGSGMMIDGFSPNLNKTLHVGHLRNLAIANSYSKVMPYSQPVALLGASLGVKQAALSGLEDWLSFTGYNPTLHYDVLMPDDIIDTRDPTPEEIAEDPKLAAVDGKFPQVWDSSYKKPVILKRADGRPLYAYYDLAFRRKIGANGPGLYYITGQEQKEHFYNLGLEQYHLPMGLVLGDDGKKMKSRDGTALSAADAMRMIEDNFDPPIESPTERRKLAWNVLAWNMLSVGRATDVKFEVKKWTKVDSPGMYITYTETRISSAFNGQEQLKTYEQVGQLSDLDVALLGTSSYLIFWWNQAVQKKDVAGLANYTHELARLMGSAYEKERIQDGRPAFRYAMHSALKTLNNCMWKLGMFSMKRI